MSKEKDIVEETMVTEENLNQFMEYLSLKKKSGVTLTYLQVICFLLCSLLILPAVFLEKIFGLGSGIFLSLIPVSVVVVGFGPFIGTGIIDKKNIREFINKYPDFDTSLDAEDVERLIKKFNINSTKEEMLVGSVRNNDKLTENNKLNCISAFEKMSVDEKIAFLEKEKEFWQQEKAKDDLEHDPIQKQIGTID